MTPLAPAFLPAPRPLLPLTSAPRSLRPQRPTAALPAPALPAALPAALPMSTLAATID
eukprot:CAMPEP_0184718268 /NCGR_PEP_ID=MMETSP0314-20130426/7524_1 /TAXON_ID=38298 /ORGANISM="Rhodella maculata, Strain CCMP 736" /LENGTH=57 /DNA_ID=CAMNT_0027181989 /DNA_START=25 /DNA_END=195 /DNA_ORIENTATION=+